MNQLKTYRLRAGLTQADLASLAGTTQPQIMRLERGERNMTENWARRLGEVLNVPPQLLMFAPAMSPVKGYVGAGAAVHFFDEELPDGYDEVEAPPNGASSTVALEVRGPSMPGVAEDRWHIYYQDRVNGVPDELIGDLCVVWLEDGNALVKRVYRGRVPGTFDLVSTGIEPIKEALVESSAKVTWIRPK